MNIPNEIYNRLIRVIPNLYSIKESGKSESSGFMDFGVDILQRNGDELRIAVHHYYKVNSDMVPDPDCEILVNRKTQTVEPLTYQDMYRYQEVGSDEKLKKDLNEFLLMWFNNLREQGHLIE